MLIYQNLGNTWLKCNEWEVCIEICNLALLIEPSAFKALFIRSHANLQGSQYDAACSDARAAVMIDLQN